MRLYIASFLCILVFVTCVSGQAGNSEFVYGRDYTFERMVATRKVNDAEDKGTIRLVTYVWRPLRNDRHEVLLFSHGSTGGFATAPAEPFGSFPNPQAVRYFLTRGYTLVAPSRRGRNESTGHYVEECSVAAGNCRSSEFTALGERALREALLDTNAVIDQLIVGRLVPRGGKILAVGQSRGGFLSLMLASERPQLVKGVVNFAGGWLGVTDQTPQVERQRRTDVQIAQLARAAKRAGVPTIWIYAVRDPWNPEGMPQELVRAWRDSGGRAEFVYITEHTLENGHVILTVPALWGRQVDAFLRTIQAAKD